MYQWFIEYLSEQIQQSDFIKSQIAEASQDHQHFDQKMSHDKIDHIVKNIDMKKINEQAQQICENIQQTNQQNSSQHSLKKDSFDEKTSEYDKSQQIQSDHNQQDDQRKSQERSPLQKSTFQILVNNEQENYQLHRTPKALTFKKKSYSEFEISKQNDQEQKQMASLNARMVESNIQNEYQNEDMEQNNTHEEGQEEIQEVQQYKDEQLNDQFENFQPNDQQDSFQIRFQQESQQFETQFDHEDQFGSKNDVHFDFQFQNYVQDNQKQSHEENQNNESQEQDQFQIKNNLQNDDQCSQDNHELNSNQHQFNFEQNQDQQQDDDQFEHNQIQKKSLDVQDQIQNEIREQIKRISNFDASKYEQIYFNQEENNEVMKQNDFNNLEKFKIHMDSLNEQKVEELQDKIKQLPEYQNYEQNMEQINEQHYCDSNTTSKRNSLINSKQEQIQNDQPSIDDAQTQFQDYHEISKNVITNVVRKSVQKIEQELTESESNIDFDIILKNIILKNKLQKILQFFQFMIENEDFTFSFNDAKYLQKNSTQSLQSDKNLEHVLDTVQKDDNHLDLQENEEQNTPQLNKSFKSISEFNEKNPFEEKEK